MEFKSLKKTLITICERSLAILSFIFPYVEISSCFARKVFLSVDSQSLKYLYINFVAKPTDLYIENIYLSFALMIVIFIACSRGTLPITDFIRFNIIQAILLNIICSCLSALFPLLPVLIRESAVGLLLANFFYLGTMFIIFYSLLLIIFGKYPRLPILSEAAYLQVQRRN